MVRTTRWDRDIVATPDKFGRWAMDAAARLKSKGPVTVPKAVRDALGIKEDNEIVIRVEGNRAMRARTPEFLELAGTIQVPAAKRNLAWDKVIRRARSVRVAARR